MNIELLRSKLELQSSPDLHNKELNHFYRVRNHFLATETFGLKYMVIIIKHSIWLASLSLEY